MLVIAPLSSRTHNDPLGSKLHCSRLGYVDNKPTQLQIATVTSASSAPTVAANTVSPFAAFNPLVGNDPPVAAVKAYDWDKLEYDNWHIGTGSEAPYPLPSPYNTVFGAIVSNTAGEYGLARVGGTSDQTSNWDSSGKFCKELYTDYTDIFSPYSQYGAGFWGIFYCNSSYWLTAPVVGMDGPNNKWYYQNVAVAQKSKYRVNKQSVGWELQVDLRIEKAWYLTPNTWTDGWPSLTDSTKPFPYWITRLKGNNYTYIRPIITWAHVPFVLETVYNTYPTGSDAANDWNYITMPPLDNPTDTLANGFCGRACFHILHETPSQLEIRLGVTVANKP